MPNRYTCSAWGGGVGGASGRLRSTVFRKLLLRPATASTAPKGPLNALQGSLVQAPQDSSVLEMFPRQAVLRDKDASSYPYCTTHSYNKEWYKDTKL